MMNIKQLLLYLVLSLTLSGVSAEQVSKEQIKGLDEQVQDIKKDVLGISAELNLLEEKLLFPSNTQIAIFVSLAGNSDFEPDAIHVQLDGKDVASHVYSFTEVEAMHKGGVQRIYTGNVRTGEHNLQVDVIGKKGSSKKTDNASTTVNKGVGPQFLEVRMNDSGIEFRNW